jgi:xanthine dehydrogenase YagR molybdenum-binding subunit
MDGSILAGGIGLPIVRRDAAAKSTGDALYAADFAHSGTAYAALTLSAVAKGRISSVDSSEAEAVPGVQLVMTHRSLNQGLGDETFAMKGGHMQSSFMPLSSDEVHYAGQIVGLIVADTVEAAEEASRKLHISYDAIHASAAMDDPGRAPEGDDENEADKGDALAAFAAAPVKVDHHYSTPAQHHNPIELYAATAVWHDDKLLVNTPSQWVIGKQAALAKIFGIPQEDVHIECPYIGGGFGSKATLLAHTVLVAAAARRLRRPVKLVVPREAMFTVGSFRPATRTRVALGAEKDGTIRSLIFEEAGQTAEIDHVAFAGTDAVSRMYDSATRRMRQSTVKTDVNTPGFQRAPAEASSFFCFESAVDELAVALDMDPIALRLKNEPRVDPVTGNAWSSRSLVQCYRRGADLFGWSRRTKQPGSMKGADGTLIGYGCATATYPSAMAPAAARVALTRDGIVQVSCAAHDLGTGAYTVLGQVAADVLGIDDAQVRVTLGDSTLPSGPVAGGSITTGSAGSAIHVAANAVRERLASALVAKGAPFAVADAASLKFAGGHVIGPDGAAKPLTELMQNVGGGTIEETAEWKPDSMDQKKMQAGLAGGMAFAGPVTDKVTSFSFGAQFAEVHIDPMLRTIRVPRMVGVFACGRIINPRTARSNLMGGMVWGASFALHEETVVDRKRARFANTDLAGYHFAANADIGEVVVETIDEHDAAVNAIGAKAVGEVGIVGMPAAIANAVYHATGIRVRKTPIRVEDLLV